MYGPIAYDECDPYIKSIPIKQYSREIQNQVHAFQPVLYKTIPFACLRKNSDYFLLTKDMEKT